MKKKLFNNLVYFLKSHPPVCEKYDIRMAMSSDDPAWPVFGLSRIITDKEHLLKLMKAVDAPFNGITLCTGSLGSNRKMISGYYPFIKRPYSFCTCAQFAV